MIWNNKKYVSKPLLVKEDSAIQRHRRWFGQFYSENSPRLRHQRDTVDFWPPWSTGKDFSWVDVNQTLQTNEFTLQFCLRQQDKGGEEAWWGYAFQIYIFVKESNLVLLNNLFLGVFLMCVIWISRLSEQCFDHQNSLLDCQNCFTITQIHIPIFPLVIVGLFPACLHTPASLRSKTWVERLFFSALCLRMQVLISFSSYACYASQTVYSNLSCVLNLGCVWAAGVRAGVFVFLNSFSGYPAAGW